MVSSINSRIFQGWVLLNYPTSYEKTALLEEALTGIPVPGALGQFGSKSITDFIDVDVYPDSRKSLDELEKFRSSHLFKKPERIQDKPFYETALTAFIRLIQCCKYIFYFLLDKDYYVSSFLTKITFYILSSNHYHDGWFFLSVELLTLN